MSGECPVCLSRDGFPAAIHGYGSYDASFVNCEVCGVFIVSRTAEQDWLTRRNTYLTPLRRAVLSAHLRALSPAQQPGDMWTSDRIERFFKNDPRLPNPSQQAINIIRLIGDEVSETGEPIQEVRHDLAALAGSPNFRFAAKLIENLRSRGWVEGVITALLSGDIRLHNLTLTLEGWHVYEQERKGATSGKFGFIAMKFGDPVLDPLISDHVKPAIRSLGYDLVDLRDVARAGVIDNLLRVQIRDAAFVLVDLTHENAGAYWEAGYAEGLGKPVLYLCEKTKFDSSNTHFDTNHCTTVTWRMDEVEGFKQELLATIRRSLEL